ncbi:MAG: sugar isomerase domain-containing protein [Candidatus Hydrogenedentes bacterium]|nr:sugar isomerase domain-containing protein [Candidatus Hydrogenedentota bacterium]
MNSIKEGAMYLEQWFQAVHANLAHIEVGERAAIVAAAEAVAASLANQGAIHVMDTGHLLRHEAYFRAGGLMAIAPLSYEFTLENPTPQRTVSLAADRAADLEARKVALALDSSAIRPGDIVIINSNSGRTANVIEMGLQCRAQGIVTIGIASLQQMTRCETAHPSGKKLFDVVDYPIDNGAPYGDAAIPVEDNEKMCPLSGIASALILWAVQAEAVERLQARGINPSIFRSVHVSGHEYIDAQIERFKRQGI